MTLTGIHMILVWMEDGNGRGGFNSYYMFPLGGAF